MVATEARAATMMIDAEVTLEIDFTIDVLVETGSTAADTERASNRHASRGALMLLVLRTHNFYTTFAS